MDNEIIKYEPLKIERFVNIACSLLLLAILAVSFYYFPRLPEKIPAHFNIKGSPDRIGDKIEFMILPAIAALVYFLLGWLARRPIFLITL